MGSYELPLIVLIPQPVFFCFFFFVTKEALEGIPALGSALGYIYCAPTPC